MQRAGVLLPCLLVLGVAGFAQEPDYDELITRDPLLKLLTHPRKLSIADLVSDPEAYRDIPVNLEIAFSARGKLENPFFTRFTKANYLNFSAWDGDQLLWERDEYLGSFPLLFTDRRHKVSSVISTAKPFERFDVRAIVRDTFRGRPWVEILEARPLDEHLTTGAVRHVRQGKLQLAKGNLALAIGEFARALKAPLPDAHRLAVLKMAARVQERLKNTLEANRLWSQAFGIAPRDPEVRAACKRILKAGERPAARPAAVGGIGAPPQGLQRSAISPSEIESRGVTAPPVENPTGPASEGQPDKGGATGDGATPEKKQP